ncbi:MAG TPA: hypothetical protein VMT63_04160 [Bacteroidales bacterium]|nr:hypothetical protein [Bacteroidales bacterium]
MEKSEISYLKFWITVILSTLVGMTIAWVDSQPNWDDTGITVAMLYISSGVAGFVSPKNPWLWALLCGIWIPVAGIARNGDLMMLLVLVVTFGGAYSGSVIRKMIKGTKR